MNPILDADLNFASPVVRLPLEIFYCVKVARCLPFFQNFFFVALLVACWHRNVKHFTMDVVERIKYDLSVEHPNVVFSCVMTHYG